MEMENGAYNQEKRMSSPPPPLYDQVTGRESNQGPQSLATTSLYQTAAIKDAQEVQEVDKLNIFVLFLARSVEIFSENFFLLKIRSFFPINFSFGQCHE